MEKRVLVMPCRTALPGGIQRVAAHGVFGGAINPSADREVGGTFLLESAAIRFLDGNDKALWPGSAASTSSESGIDLASMGMRQRENADFSAPSIPMRSDRDVFGGALLKRPLDIPYPLPASRPWACFATRSDIKRSGKATHPSGTVRNPDLDAQLPGKLGRVCLSAAFRAYSSKENP